MLQRELPDIAALRDVTSEQLEAHKHLLPELVYRRCRHGERKRARHADGRLRPSARDLAEAGRLMDASHASLRDDYEVSNGPRRHGRRHARRRRRIGGVTGASGCAIALVEPGSEQAVGDAIFDLYPKATNIWPEIYTSRPAPAHVLELRNPPGKISSRDADGIAAA